MAEEEVKHCLLPLGDECKVREMPLTSPRAQCSCEERGEREEGEEGGVSITAGKQKKRQGIHVEEGFGQEWESLKRWWKKARERGTVYVSGEDAVAREQQWSRVVHLLKLAGG